MSPDCGLIPFYIWNLADTSETQRHSTYYPPSLYAGITDNTAYDGNLYSFSSGVLGNRVFLLLEQHYRQTITLYSCGTNRGLNATGQQQLAQFPLPSVAPLATTPLQMEFAADKVRLLMGVAPFVNTATDADGWITYTGPSESGRVNAPLGATRFWFMLAGGELPGPREVVIADQPQTTTRFTSDGSPVTETSLAVTGPLTLTHDATIRARVYSAAAYRSPETVAVFTSTIPLLPAESFVSPAYMEILHATLDGSPALVSLSGPSGTTNGFAINNHRFILRYPLQFNEPTPVTLSRTTLPDLSTNIVWREIDLAASSLPDPMAIRAGDSLLFTAGVGATGTLHIAVMDGSNQVCQTREGVTGEKFPVRFDQGGTFTVIASVDGISVGSLIVHVVYVDFDGPVACQVGYKREKGVAVYGPTNQVFFTAKDPALLEVSVKEVTSYGVRLYLKALGRGTPVVQARLGSATGPILAEQEVEEFTADSSAAQHLVVNGATDTANTILTMKPWIPNVDINFAMYAHYSTFAGGATAYTLNTSDQTSVDINGDPSIDLSVDPTTGETQAVIRVDIEIPADEDSYCFSADFDQHSKYGTVFARIVCNGNKCIFRIKPIFICEGCPKAHKLPCRASGINRNVSNHKDIAHPHKMSAVEATKFEISPRATVSGFNCRTDSLFPDWDPDVNLLSGATAADAPYSVKICGTTFPNVITVFKVDLITPAGNPVLLPVEGGDGSVPVPDGANEFTFSPVDPFGILTLPLKAKVTPNGIANQVAGQCRMDVSTIIGSTLVWVITNPGGIPTASGDNLLATVKFVGLPKLNTSFGKKKATVYDADGCKLDEKDYEVFFPKTAKNHDGIGSGVTPNWYYYWAGTAVPGYDHTSLIFFYGGYRFNYSGEYQGPSDHPTITLYDDAALDEVVYASGGLSINKQGIDACARAVMHERTHWWIDDARQPGGSWDPAIMADDDGDNIPDKVEQANASLGLNWLKKSSFTPSFLYGNDEEFWCEWTARNIVGDASKDWANPGKQSKNTY